MLETIERTAMREYPKIETLYERGADFSVTDVLRSPVIGTISHANASKIVDSDVGGWTGEGRAPESHSGSRLHRSSRERPKQQEWGFCVMSDLAKYRQRLATPTQFQDAEARVWLGAALSSIEQAEARIAELERALRQYQRAYGLLCEHGQSECSICDIRDLQVPS